MTLTQSVDKLHESVSVLVAAVATRLGIRRLVSVTFRAAMVIDNWLDWVQAIITDRRRSVNPGPQNQPPPPHHPNCRSSVEADLPYHMRDLAERIERLWIEEMIGGGLSFTNSHGEPIRSRSPIQDMLDEIDGADADNGVRW